MFHVERADKETVTKIVNENVARESRLNTDESKLYTGSDTRFAGHHTVKHTAGEYVRVELDHVNEDESEFHFRTVHTNTMEGVFSIIKRGMHGVYQHCGEKHLIGISPSSSSGTTIGSRSACMTRPARRMRFVASSASA